MDAYDEAASNFEQAYGEKADYDMVFRFTKPTRAEAWRLTGHGI